MSDSDKIETEQSDTEKVDAQSVSTSQSYVKTALINSSALGLFAVITAFILGAVYVNTKDQIEASRAAAEKSALLEVIGEYPHDNDILSDTIVLNDTERSLLGGNGDANIYLIRSQNKTTGFIFPAVAPDGYSGNIGMLIGIDIEGNILGVRVIEHKETPGLGDKIDLKKNDWILEFAGKSLLNPSEPQWTVTKDGGSFDAFTGATITPRAVVKRVHSVLSYFRDKQVQLIARAETAAEFDNTVSSEEN